jgi:Domain of unknown function (DUF4260)
MSVHLPFATDAQRRVAYGLAFALLLGVTAFAVAEHGHLGAALAGGLGPDLALLLGAGTGLAKGQLHPRAVPFYNAVHRFWLPVGLVIAASAGLLGVGWLTGGLGWCAHVAMDRMAGYGLRSPEGFQRAA